MKTIQVGDREARLLEKLAEANDTDVAEILELMFEFIDVVVDHYHLHVE